jgi:1-acyl-sn-glycerol-3-phosphate acyltransferase
MRLPELPARIPRQGGVLSASLAYLMLRALGWRFEGQVPNVPKAVLIVAPHTSNWDFPLGLLAKTALRLRVSWLGKHTLFGPPWGWLWRALGGLPVNRSAAGGLVDDVVRAFAERTQLVLALSPEGTRSKVERWKSGFHRMALAAGVPIVPLAFDYSVRAVRFLPPLTPGPDYEADLASLRAHFTPGMAYRPENY